MTNTYRHPVTEITVNGTAITDVISWNVTFPLNESASADIVTHSKPANITPWDEIVITAGATTATKTTRFTGYFTSYNVALYPNEYTLHCRGKLALAEDAATDTDVDLSSDGAGDTDERIVSHVLHDCGYRNGSWTWESAGTTSFGGVSGTGRELGKVSKARGFTWRKSERGLDFIRRLDNVCVVASGGTYGRYITHDTAGGTITRSFISSIPT